MSLKDLSGRHLKLISVYSTRHAVRGGSGLVFLLLAVFFGLIIANMLIQPVEVMVKEGKAAGFETDAAEAVDRLIELGRPVISWAISGDLGGPLGGKSDDSEAAKEARERAREWTSYLLDENPALLSAIFFILVFAMPFIIPFGAFNQTAGDIGNRGLRYLLLRTERANIYFGRFLGTAVFSILVQGFTVLTIALYVGLKLKIYGGASVASWSLCGFLALSVLSLPYVAVCAWISASNESGMVSLVVSKLVIGGVLFAAFVAGKAWAPASILKYALPWGVQNQLLAPGVGEVTIAVVSCFAYTVFFLFLGYRRFMKRDL